MDKIPLKDFRTRASPADVRRWYAARLLVAGALLKRHKAALSGFTPEDVLHETLVRIEARRTGYTPMAEALGETDDQYMRRCLERTISSFRSEGQKTQRRRKHDANLARDFYDEPRARLPRQENGIHLRDAQRRLDEVMCSQPVGEGMKALAADATRLAQMGLTSKEIASETGEREDTVRKRRTRLEELVEAYFSTRKEASK